jgi:hypothetical protein
LKILEIKINEIKEEGLGEMKWGCWGRDDGGCGGSGGRGKYRGRESMEEMDGKERRNTTN